MPIVFVLILVCISYVAFLGVKNLTHRRKVKMTAKRHIETTFSPIKNTMDLKREKAKLEKRVNALISKERALAAAIHQFRKEINDNKTINEKIDQDKCENSHSKESILENRVKDLVNQEHQLSNTIANLTLDKTRESANLMSIQSDIKAAVSKKTIIETFIQDLINQKQEIIEEIDNIQTTKICETDKLSSIRVEIETADFEKTSAEIRIQSLLNKEQELLSKLSELQFNVDKYKNKFNELYSNVGSLNEDILTLSTRRHEIENATVKMEQDIEIRRNIMLSDMETTIAAQKEIALTQIMAWSENEKARLKKRFEDNYQTEIAALRQKLVDKVSAELDSIHNYFSAFASEKKLMVENDIMRFITEKRSAILTNIHE
ncbi:putative Chromosome partition protein Smc [Azospirillaceae bacterium]